MTTIHDHISTYKRGMDNRSSIIIDNQWIMDAGGHLGSAAIDLEVAGSGPVSCRFLFPSLSYDV